MANNSRRISGSMSVDEAEIGAAVVRALLMGSDVRLLMRRPAFAGFARRMQRLAARADQCPPKKAPPVTRDDLVLAALAAHGEAGATRNALAAEMGLHGKNVAWYLWRLQKQKRAVRVGWGPTVHWRATEAAPKARTA